MPYVGVAAPEPELTEASEACVLCGQAIDSGGHDFDMCFEHHLPVKRASMPRSVAPLNRQLFRIGKLPAGPAVLSHSYLELPERLALACASSHANKLCDDDEGYAQCATSLWTALWGSVSIPDGRCGCHFSSPEHVQSISPRMKAMGLWHLRSLTALDIEVRDLSNKCRAYTVEPHVTVAEFRNLVAQTFHDPPWDLICSPQMKRLSHSAAPLAVYLWPSFCRGPHARRPPLLNVTCQLFPWCNA